VVSLEMILRGKKICMVVITKPSNEEKEEEMIHLTLNHIIIKEDDNDKFFIEEDVEEALLTFESKNKFMVDEIKEVNLGTIENPCMNFINANLSSKGKGDYMELFMECRDIFTWSYDEMPCLDLRVIIYHLTIRNGVRLVK
jgi:electron transfer flavoprotein alpha subunit